MCIMTKKHSTLNLTIETMTEMQGPTFPGAQGHMPLDFAVGP